MISYAQNGEDVVLARVFDAPTGFYIDLGAASPELHSVTKHFSDRGWRGINVDPAPRWYDELVSARPRDISLAVGVSDKAGTLTLFDTTTDAAEESTFSPEVAARLRARGVKPVSREVAVLTLAEICEAHVHEEIDFLKIDVEGFELNVIEGGDWERFRPRVVVIEALRPVSLQMAVDALDAEMLAARYTSALFDGLNRFYVRDEDTELIALLGVPANVTDGYVTAEQHGLQLAAQSAQDRAERAIAELGEGRRALAATRERLAEAERRADESLHGEAATAALLATAQASLALGEREMVAARGRAADAELQFEATRDALQRLIEATRSEDEG